MDSGRTQKSIVNLLFGVSGQVINIVVRFLLRTIFIYKLGKEYLGLSGLFTNIISILSLAELGVGVAIVYALYRPIADNDERQISALMVLYKKTYIIIGSVILTIGVSLTPFLQYLIKDMPALPYIRLIYVLYIFNSSVSYFFSYKAALITANQKNYIVVKNHILFQVLSAIVQAISLILFSNYLLYLIIMLVFTFIENIRISVICDKMYSFVNKYKTAVVPVEVKRTIVDNIRAIFIHRIGGAVVFSTDNLLLSKIFGLGIVGIYSNYMLVIASMEGMISQFFTAITASVGNLRVETSTDKQLEIYKKVMFIQFWIYTYATTMMACIFSPFIKAWLGDEYLISNMCLVFVLVNFYLKGMRQINGTFNVAYGLSRYYTFMPIPESIINLGTSILFAFYVGPAGIFIGTTISTLTMPFLIEPYILFKKGFNKSISIPLALYVRYVLLSIVVIVTMYMISSFIHLNGFIGVGALILVDTVLANTIIIVLSKILRIHEFEYVLGLIRRRIKL